MLKKILKFVLSNKDGIIIFNLSFILLLVEVDLILEKQSYQRNAFVICGIDYIKIVLILSTKLIIFYI